jgi:hypothetical protein
MSMARDEQYRRRRKAEAERLRLTGKVGALELELQDLAADLAEAEAAAKADLDQRRRRLQEPDASIRRLRELGEELPPPLGRVLTCHDRKHHTLERTRQRLAGVEQQLGEIARADQAGREQ